MSFFETFWFLGMIIIVLATIPHYFYVTYIADHKKEKQWVLKIEPVASRAILVLIFYVLSSLSQSQKDLVSSSIDKVSTVTEMNNCVDEYTQADSARVLKLLRNAEGQIGW